MISEPMTAIRDEVLDIEAAPSLKARQAFYQGLSPFWHPLVSVESLQRAPIQPITLLGRRLVVARLKHGILVADNLCRHRNAALSDGQIVDSDTWQPDPSGDVLECGYHGWSYDLDGHAVRIPAATAPIPADAKVQRYPVHVAHELVWTRLGPRPRATAEDLPYFPELRDSRFHFTPLHADEWPCSLQRAVEAALDDTHFPWVHPGFLGDRRYPQAPAHTVTRHDGIIHTHYVIWQPPGPSVHGEPDAAHGGLAPVNYDQFTGINVSRLDKWGPDRAGHPGEPWHYIVWFTASPTTYNITRLWWRLGWDFDLGLTDEEVETNQVAIAAQDKRITAGQRPWLLAPLSAGLTLPLREADKPLIAFSQWMEELGIPAI